jgi:hypothetical protein
MTTFVIAHGAWSAGWAWKKMHALLGVSGDRLFSPTYTGLGERAHLASPSNDLETHIQDVLGVLEYEDLRDGRLDRAQLWRHGCHRSCRPCARSDQAPRVSRCVCSQGWSESSRSSPGRAGMRRDAERRGNGWRVPPNPTPPDTSPIDEAWIAARRQPQSIACFEMPLRLRNGELTVPRTYIYCTRSVPGDVFRQFAERAQREGWGYYQIEASHSPH